MPQAAAKRQPGSTARSGVFGASAPVEKFRLDETRGILLRSVIPRDPASSPIWSDIGEVDQTISLDDLRAAADIVYLRRRTPPPVPEIASAVRAADLFSGCGAMSLGLAEACRALGHRFEPKAAFDIDQRVLDIYGRNFDIPTPAAVDLAEILQSDLGAAVSPAELEWSDKIGPIDFLLAGPPCQGHSNLNNHTRRNDPKNALYFLVARAAELLRPHWIIIENVIAVLHDKSDVVHRTQVALESLGYATRDGIVELRSIGVAQARKRHVLVAELATSTTAPTLPPLTDLLAPHTTRARSVGWAIGDLLNVPTEHFMDRQKVPDPITQARIEYLFDNGLYDLPNSQRPDCHKQGTSYKSVYGRMKWEEPAPTITGGFDTMGQGRFVHPKRQRTITPHEAARLQSIPDFFDLSPMVEQANRLVETIGNAVPPKLSYVLALELMR